MSILENIRLLIVEDDETTLKLLNMYFKDKVGNIWLAQNGEEGLNKYFQHKPNLIITDIQMPIMTGKEMVEQIRTYDRLISIIVLTGVNDNEYLMSLANQAIDAYILKPVDNVQLENKLVEVAHKIGDFIETSGGVSKFSEIDTMAKIELENNIKKIFQSTLKEEVGKGPSSIFISFFGNYLRVECSDIFTVFEKTMLGNKSNHQLITYSRSLYYRNNYKIMKTLEKLLSYKVELYKIQTNVSENKDILTYRIIM